jgi:hypothetical protein
MKSQFQQSIIWTSFMRKTDWYACITSCLSLHSSHMLDLWSIPIHSDFLSLCSYKQTNIKTIYIYYISSLFHLRFAWYFFTYAFLAYSSNFINTNGRSISSFPSKSKPLLRPNHTISLHLGYDMSLIMIICNETYSKLIKLISNLIVLSFNHQNPLEG